MTSVSLAERQHELALLGGSKLISGDPGDLLTWPIITREDEEAALAVLRGGDMSGTSVTRQFEEEYAAWQGNRYALGFCNGTASLQAAMFGIGLGRGDEIICPSITYWASCLQAYSLGASVVFADIDPVTLCIDPADIEQRITPRTKAIVAVHYLGHPCDMDAILDIARRRGLRVIEDISHAQGGLYKGRKLGTFGDVSGISLMSGKSLASGEGGMLTTDDREVYERAVAFSHYERFTSDNTESEQLIPYCGLPLGGVKGRMHQVSAAVGRVQLRHYDARCAEIRESMAYFRDLLEDLPGLSAHRVDESEGSNMAGCYHPVSHYRPEELGGLSVERYCAALCAEGIYSRAGCNAPLHRHALFNSCDVYGDGSPTRSAFAGRDLHQDDTDLPVASAVSSRTLSIPWFKHFRPAEIEAYAGVFRKVSENYEALLPGDEGSTERHGHIGLSGRA